MCFRCQYFPDFFTAIPKRKTSHIFTEISRLFRQFFRRPLIVGLAELRKVIAGHHVIIGPESAEEKGGAVGDSHEKELFAGAVSGSKNVVDFLFWVGEVKTVNFSH